MTEQDWNFAEGHYLSYILAAATGAGEPLFVVLNAAEEPIEFTFPRWSNVQGWVTVLDTASYPQAPEPSPQSVGSRLSSAAISVMAFAGLP